MNRENHLVVFEGRLLEAALTPRVMLNAARVAITISMPYKTYFMERRNVQAPRASHPLSSGRVLRFSVLRSVRVRKSCRGRRRSGPCSGYLIGRA